MEEIIFSGQRVAFRYNYIHVPSYPLTSKKGMKVHCMLYDCMCVRIHVHVCVCRCTGRVTSLNGHPLEGVIVMVCRCSAPSIPVVLVSTACGVLLSSGTWQWWVRVHHA